jgi:flagellar M-ring protein FliF
MADNAIQATPVRRPFGGAFLEGLEGLGILRQMGLMIGLAASVAMGFALILWIQGEDYKPLYGSLENLDAPEVVRILESNAIPYKIEQNSGALLVASDDIHTARLKLSEAGVQVGNGRGFELLDQEQPLGTSQFMEQTRFRRGLEGELSRTISSINSVRSARVHLAIPKSTVFIRDPRRPSASVLLELYAGRALLPEQVMAIGNLVASSVPELELKDVTVVDQRGNLLSGFNQDSELDAANKQLDYQRKLEERLSRRIHGILEPMLGEGRFRAEVAADIDFTAVEQTQEMYNPEATVIRSEQISEERNLNGSDVGGVPGALANQPSPDGNPATVTDSNGLGEKSMQATRNYEVDRTIAHTRHQVGKITRLTVAVAVDDHRAAGVDGVAGEVTAWSEDELERIRTLVSNAVGFDSTRGDVINVVNKRFIEPETFEIQETAFYETEWFNKYAKLGASVVVMIVLVLGVLRPLFTGITSVSSKAKEGEVGSEFSGLDMYGGSPNYGDSKVSLSGVDSMLLPSGNEGYEQQLLAIRGLVAEDSGRVAQVIKQWISQDE